jgi:glucose/mannose transport system permease protein
VLYVIGTMAIGLLLAIMIDQRVRGEAAGARSISIRWPSPSSSPARSGAGSSIPLRHRVLVHGWASPASSSPGPPDRNLAIYAIVITGIWQASGFAMALFLAGLRSVDQDLIKAAQIDGAGMARIYRRIVIPAIGRSSSPCIVVLLQFAIKTFDLAWR